MSTIRSIRDDLERHDGDPMSSGFVAMAVYRFGRWRGQLRRGFIRKLFYLPYMALQRRARNRHRIELHYTADMAPGVRLSRRGDIVIGNDVVIGEGCSVGHGVTIGKTRADATGWPVIGRNVIIGPGAVIAGDLHVGDQALIGPNTVVLADIQPGAVVSARDAVRPAEGVVPAGDFSGPYATLPGWPVTRVQRLKLRSRRVFIGRTAQIGAGVRLHRDGRIRIGEGSSIGDGCIISYGTTIGWAPRDRAGRGRGATTHLGHRVIVGTGATIMAGVTIGDEAIIGPNAVISVDVPAGARMMPPPAGVLRRLGGERVPSTTGTKD
jgi:serine O-acetyltransferase